MLLGTVIINCSVPLANMFGFSTELRSSTQVPLRCLLNYNVLPRLNIPSVSVIEYAQYIQAEIEYTQCVSRRTMLCLAAAAGAGRSGPLPAAAAGSGPQLLKQPAAAGSGPRQRVRRRAAAASLRGSRLDGLPEVPALISSLDPTRAPAGQGRVHHGDLCVWASTGVWPHSTC